jgi:hypothetical protein
MMKRTPCDFCGRKAKRRVSLPGHPPLLLCNGCVKVMKAEMARHGMSDLGNGVYCPKSALVLSVVEYGSPLAAEYVSAAVHEGSRVIESEVYSKSELTDEQIENRISGLLNRHQVSAVLTLDQRAPVEFHQCGSLVIRIADGQQEPLAETYKPFENN